MTQITLLATAIKLIQESEAEQTRKDSTNELMRLSNISLTRDFIELEKDYAQIHSDCEKAESAVNNTKILIERLMSTSNAVESLTNDLCAANDANGKLINDSLSMAALQRKIAEQAIEIKSLGVYKRKSEVLTRDLKTMESKYQTARTQKAAPVKQGKNSGKAFQLERKLEEAGKVIAGYASHYLVSPQFEGDYQHSKQGVISLYRLNHVLMTIDRNGDGPKDVKVERMIMMNSYNSCKVVTRIAGENQLGHVSLPKGCTISIDDEMMDWSVERFKENDRNIAALKQNRGI